MIRCRHRWLWTLRGSWPLVCMVNSENPHESQHRSRVPPRRSDSSSMSKHAHVGQTNAQRPAPQTP